MVGDCDCDCDRHFGHKAITPPFCYAWGTFLFLLITPLANAHQLSFDYNFTDSADVKQLILQGNFSASSSGIYLAADPNGNGSVGRVTSPQLLHLWNRSSNELKKFTTHFSFTVFTNQLPGGDGFTFFLANPNLPDVNATDEIQGGGIGIGRVDNVRLRALPNEYHFVAVEFDTFSNHWDPDYPHVGVNVNSMESEIVEKWGTGVSSRLPYDCSIEYNSQDYLLNVSFTGYIFSGEHVNVVRQYLGYHIDLSHYLQEWVIVGISAATAALSEEHCLLSWSFNKKTPSNDHHKKRSELINKKLLVGVGIGFGWCVTLFLLIYFLLRKRKKGNEREEEATSETASDLKMDDEFLMGIGPKKISYKELVSATNNFEKTLKLGQGGFGCVYKGYFKDMDSYAAMKRISVDSTQGVKEYTTEVMIISQLRHRNLVKLIGWCHKKNDLFLIYEYMPNGSLGSCLFGGEKLLSWKVRYNVALDLASALLYLQEEWEKCVIHRDIKSSNIMLDSNFNAKLGDFGLARLVDHEKGSHTTVMEGRIGYLAPEYMTTGKAGKESDIFSFGVVLLEVATGRKAIHHKDMEGQVSLVEWVWKLYGLRNLLSAADPYLYGEFDEPQMECLLAVGLWCANPNSKARPSIKQVVKVLNFEAPFPILQP